jgi:hypothetical protein
MEFPEAITTTTTTTTLTEKHVGLTNIDEPAAGATDPATTSSPQSQLDFATLSTYKHFGMGKPLEEMIRSWPEILYYPIEQQAEYGDIIVRSHVDDMVFCSNCVRDICQNYPNFPPENSNGVGNLAFLSLNIKDTYLSSQLRRTYESYLAILKDKFPPNITTIGGFAPVTPEFL